MVNCIDITYSWHTFCHHTCSVYNPVKSCLLKQFSIFHDRDKIYICFRNYLKINYILQVISFQDLMKIRKVTYYISVKTLSWTMTNFISKYPWSSISGNYTFKLETFIICKSIVQIFNKIRYLTEYERPTDMKG